MPRLVNVCIKIPEDLYEKLEKRAKVVGINVQMYVRTLLERHISRTREKVGGLGVKEVDLMMKLQHVIRNIKTSSKDNFRDIVISKTCSEDLKHMAKYIINEIKQRIPQLCMDQLLEDCKEYKEFEYLRTKLEETQDSVEMIKFIASRYSEDVLLHLKQLFFMERCTLIELAKVVHGAFKNSLQRLFLVLLNLE